MKKGLLNYSITWKEDGANREECYFTKRSTVKRYIDLLDSDRDARLSGKHIAGISSLTVWEIYSRPDKPAQDITGAINKFLA